jgi:hypothetical protein
MRRHRVAAIVAGTAVSLFLMPDLHAQGSPDPNLPTVHREESRQLSDTRVREHIIQESLEHYPNRCVCPYQTKDLHGRSCKRRHEVVKTAPLPVCYPRQVSSEMTMEWRRRHHDQHDVSTGEGRE